jgi:hypothetical protein
MARRKNVCLRENQPKEFNRNSRMMLAQKTADDAATKDSALRCDHFAAAGSGRQQDAGQGASRLDKIGKRVIVKHGKICIKRFAQDAAQPARRCDHAGIRILVETFHKDEILGFPHDFSDRDVLGWSRQAQTATPAAHCLEETQPAQLESNLHQVVFRYPIGLRNLLYLHQRVALQGGVHQKAQGIIGMMGQAHAAIFPVKDISYILL